MPFRDENLSDELFNFSTYTGFKDEEKDRQVRVLKAMHLNMALCYLKTNKNEEAKKECNNVLEKDPDNEKAVFRRGQVSTDSASK